MKREHILIADDEIDIATILKIQLEESGYLTSRARDGVEVMEMLQKKKFDLILLDIRMPRMDGIKALESISEKYADTPVIIMTAHGSETIAVDAMHHGATDYVSKPFSFDDLLKRIERAIQFNRTKIENIRLQTELAAEQQKTAAILDGMADMLLAVDSNGLIIQANRAAEVTFCRVKSEMIGRHISEVVKGDLSRGTLPALEAIAKKEPLRDMAYTVASSSGPLPVLSNASPLFNSDGVWGSVEILRDVSALKQLEQEKEDFVSMLSHDLKSPITAIVGSMDLVREGRLGAVNEEQKEFLDDAVESCSELVDMIDTLLDIHKFESGKMTLHIRPDDPVIALQRLVTRYRVVARRSDMVFKVEAADNLPKVLIDRSKFIRLAGNLLSNAFKFTPEKGEVKLKMSTCTADSRLATRIPETLYPADSIPSSGRFFLLSVSDNGVGIAKELLGDIFDRFMQGKNRRLGKVKGTGLGLAFCRKVMDAHGGLVWAESETGAGSSFIAAFPLGD